MRAQRKSIIYLPNYPLRLDLVTSWEILDLLLLWNGQIFVLVLSRWIMRDYVNYVSGFISLLNLILPTVFKVIFFSAF
jgi:hypothetical protein